MTREAASGAMTTASRSRAPDTQALFNSSPALLPPVNLAASRGPFIQALYEIALAVFVAVVCSAVVLMIVIASMLVIQG